MENWEDIDPAQIKEGILLDEDQVNYIASCLKGAIQLVDSLHGATEIASNSDPKNEKFANTLKFIKNIDSDLKYCVTILRKDNDL